MSKTPSGPGPQEYAPSISSFESRLHCFLVQACMSCSRRVRLQIPYMPAFSFPDCSSKASSPSLPTRQLSTVAEVSCQTSTAPKLSHECMTTVWAPSAHGCSKKIFCALGSRESNFLLPSTVWQPLKPCISYVRCRCVVVVVTCGGERRLRRRKCVPCQTFVKRRNCRDTRVIVSASGVQECIVQLIVAARQ
jgi:hypothetical protein